MNLRPFFLFQIGSCVLAVSLGCTPHIRYIVPPTVSLPANFVYPLNSTSPPITQDVSNAYNFVTLMSNTPTSPSYTCTYQSVGLSSSDPNYAPANTPCSLLAGLQVGSVNSTLYLSTATFSNGTLSWLPSSTQRGTYAFNIGSSCSTLATTGTFYVTVREPYTNPSTILNGFDATHNEGTTGLSAVPSVPRTSAGSNNDRSSWLSITGSSAASLSSFGTATPWIGSGTFSSPYALSFNPLNNDAITIGSTLNSQTGALFNTWISPASSGSTGTVILGNGDGSGHGFTLRQSSSSPGTIELLNDSGTVCQSPSTLSSGSWYFVSGMTYGTNTSMYINGQQACSVTAGSAYSPSSAMFTVGSNPSAGNYWNGSLADLKLYGTTNSTAPETVAQIQTDFSATANRFRATPVEDIYTTGLVLNFDPANGNQGLSAYSNGCAASQLSFFDLSPTGLNGTLENFSSPCTTDGWLGSGTVGDPYRLTFNGTTDGVNTSGSLTTLGASMSAAMWINTISSSNTRVLNMSAFFTLTASGGFARAALQGTSAVGGAVADGNWHYLAAVGTATTLYLYVDKKPVVTASGTFNGSYNLGPYLGQNGAGSLYYPGSIGPVLLWSQSLTAAQIKQTCLAQEHRFTSIPQSICGSP